MPFELKDFIKIRKQLKDKGKILIFTNGCFDIIHRGHITYLNKAKELGDFLVVGLNSDSSVKKIKDESRPLNTEDDRAYVLENLKPVDGVIIFEENTPLNLIDAIQPDFLVKGGDWKEDEIAGADLVKSNGGKVVIIKYVDNYSTTSVINKIKKSD
ncbi:MAG: D-glycero-beta-D-manno-heptose 1-phosphate adenylyltransferase [Ignavibacteria bacterium]|nr:D-glycero-beta-D-manno-heptose 1-phosphate adenylyltransferase [Ignavibacteria bacterium]